jgi:hypothetical protein
MLSRRLQLLVDEDRYLRLKLESERVGAPVGELVRRAIDREYPSETTEREAAGRRLLSRPKPPGREPDWEDVKNDMLDELGRKLSRAQ